MAEQEQFTAEQAEALFAESFNKVTGKEYSTIRIEDPAPTPAIEEKPVVETSAPIEEKKEEPATVGAVTPEKKEEAVAEAPAKKDEPADPYAWVGELPENIRGKVMQEINARMTGEHYRKSNEGRIAAYQRQLLDAERKLATLKPAGESQPAPAARSPQTPEEWNKLAKDDPEIASAVEARVKSEVDAAVSSVESKLQGLQKSADVLYQHEQRQYVDNERQALQAIVPNYVDVMNSPEFKGWLDAEASPGIRNLAMTSVHHMDAVNVLRSYADDMIRSGRATPRQEPVVSATATTKAPEKTETSEADRIAADRDARSKQTTVVTPPAATFAGAGTNKAQYTQDDAEAEFLKAWQRVNPKKT